MEQVPCLGDFDSTYFYLNEDGKISLIGSPSPTPQGGLYIAEDPEGVTNYIVNNEGQNIQWEGGLLSPTIQWDSGFSQLPATELIEDQKVNILVAKNHIGYRITLHELASFVRENTHELAMFIPFGLFNFEGGRFTVQLEGTGGSIFSSSVQDWTTQGMIFLLDTIGDFSNYNAAEYVFVGGSVTLTTVSGKTISENQMRVKNQDDRLLCCSAKEATDRVLYTIKLLQISYNSNTNRSSAVVQVTLDPNYTGETIKTVSNLSIHLTSASPKTSVVAGYVVTLPGDWTRYNVTITSPQPEYWVSDKQFFTSSDGIYGLWGYTII